jgi:hypothetical protein
MRSRAAERISLAKFQGRWRIVRMMVTRRDGNHHSYKFSATHVRVEGNAWTFEYGRPGGGKGILDAGQHDTKARSKGPGLPYAKSLLKTVRHGNPVMPEITFSEADVQAIAHDRYHHPDPRVQRHMEILWLKHHGFNHQRLAWAKLSMCARSGRSWPQAARNVCCMSMGQRKTLLSQHGIRLATSANLQLR